MSICFLSQLVFLLGSLLLCTVKYIERFCVVLDTLYLPLIH